MLDVYSNTCIKLAEKDRIAYKKWLGKGLPCDKLMQPVGNLMPSTPLLEQRNVSPKQCSLEIQSMKKLIESVKKTDNYFSRLFSVQVNIHLQIIYMLKY